MATSCLHILTWEVFEEELWARFGLVDCEDFDEALSRVTQVNSLQDYQKEFERLGNRVKEWTQKALVGTFMGGHKSEIAEGIRMFKPHSLKEAFSLTNENSHGHQNSFVCNLTFQHKQTTPASRMKGLTWEEMQRRRAQGPKLLLLEGSYSSNAEDETNEETIIEPHISLHALTGWTMSRTMRVPARIGPYEVAVLFDSGYTHNFISEKVSNLLQYPMRWPFNVKVANGNPLKCQGRFQLGSVLLQGIPFSLTLYSLPFIGLDLVLGIQWLEQSGIVVCNWKDLTMQFQWKKNGAYKIHH